METYAHLFRMFVIFMVVVAWYALSRRTGSRWQHMTRLGKRLWVWYYILLFAVAYGTIEAFQSDAPLNTRNYVLAFAVGGLMIAALLRLKGDESTDPVYKIHLEGNITKWYIRKLR